MGAPADLVLTGGRVWTVDRSRPTASWVACRAGDIVGLGEGKPDRALMGSDTTVVDLAGRMVVPGFVDAHTHFGNAVLGHFHLRLNDVDDEAGILAALAERSPQVAPVWWLTGGEWSAIAAASRGRGTRRDFFPSLDAVDRITSDRPVFLRRYDGAGFINTFGMRLLHLAATTPDPPNGLFGRDADGQLTGALYGSATRKVEQMLPPHNLARSLVGGEAIVSRLNRLGIVGIHDIARLAEASDAAEFQTHVERSFTDLRLFHELRARGVLTMRVHPVLTLRTWDQLERNGIGPGSGDEHIWFGTLKAFVGGFYMTRPFRNNPGFAGSLSFRNRDEAQVVDEIIAADAAGWNVAVHVTGDRGHSLAVDAFERAVAVNPPRTRRHRLVHAWYPSPRDIDRAGALSVFGDITPFHLIREQPSIMQKLHPDQLDSAFAWRSMIGAGWDLNIVSDWPGSFDGNHDAPVDPLRNIEIAVTRRDDRATEPFAAHQHLSVEEAISAYTINPARAARAEGRMGSIAHGKVADLTVISHDLFTIPASEIRDAQVEMTVFAGSIVHDLIG